MKHAAVLCLLSALLCSPSWAQDMGGYAAMRVDKVGSFKSSFGEGFRFKDWREFTYDLERTQVVDPGEVIERAAVLRQDAKLASEQPAKEAVRLKPGGIPVYFDPEDPIWFQPE